MKRKLMLLMLMAGGALFAAPGIAIGVRIGAPPPVVVRSYRPPCPAPGYVWVDGYYDPYGNWYDGYWALPPYPGAYWVAPRYAGPRFVSGYWYGPRGYYTVPPSYYRGREYRGHERREHEWREHEWREHENHGHGNAWGRRGRDD